jgi:hypothetical protein
MEYLISFPAGAMCAIERKARALCVRTETDKYSIPLPPGASYDVQPADGMLRIRTAWPCSEPPPAILVLPPNPPTAWPCRASPPLADLPIKSSTVRLTAWPSFPVSPDIPGFEHCADYNDALEHACRKLSLFSRATSGGIPKDQGHVIEKFLEPGELPFERIIKALRPHSWTTWVVTTRGRIIECQSGYNAAAFRSRGGGAFVPLKKIAALVTKHLMPGPTRHWSQEDAFLNALQKLM